MTLTSQNVLDALSTVIDPEIRRPITDLNMVDEVVIDGSTVSVTILLTTAGCPLRNTISEDVHKVLGALDGVTDVKVTMDVMNDEQKKALREKLNGGRPEREILFARPDSLTRVIAVTSGKGGVGKSSMTANLAAALARSGLKVGVMDADIYGFSIPRMLGVTHDPQVIDGMIIPPLGAQGVKVVSIGMFVPDGQPVIWRGFTVHFSSSWQMFSGEIWTFSSSICLPEPATSQSRFLSSSPMLRSLSSQPRRLLQPKSPSVRVRSRRRRTRRLSASSRTCPTCLRRMARSLRSSAAAADSLSQIA